MYREGLGVPQDYVEAHKWFNLAVASLPAEDGMRGLLAVWPILFVWVATLPEGL